MIKISPYLLCRVFVIRVPELASEVYLRCLRKNIKGRRDRYINVEDNDKVLILELFLGPPDKRPELKGISQGKNGLFADGKDSTLICVLFFLKKT